MVDKQIFKQKVFVQLRFVQTITGPLSSKFRLHKYANIATSA